MLSGIMMNVAMLSVIMLNVVEAFFKHSFKDLFEEKYRRQCSQNKAMKKAQACFKKMIKFL
jgi:hypothetical protein